MQTLDLLAPPTLAFALSLLVSVLLPLTQRWHGQFSLDLNFGVQKLHFEPTPRVGGIGVLLGALAGVWVMQDSDSRHLLGTLVLAGLPAFVFGLAEDMSKRVPVWARLLATMGSGLLGWAITDVAIRTLGIPVLDELVAIPVIAVAFTAFAVGGVANALNIIDGLNGLAGGFVTLAFMTYSLLALASNDLHLALVCLVLAAASVGFLVVNWPLGRLFLGDGGSYFLGFSLAWVAVMLMHRTGTSAFVALLVCMHPVSEVLFSIYRRTMRRSSPGDADRLHLHSLVLLRYMRRWVPRNRQNSVSGALMVMISVPNVLLALALRNNPAGAAWACLGFSLAYVLLYARIVHHRWCLPMSFLLPRRCRPWIRESSTR